MFGIQQLICGQWQAWSWDAEGRIIPLTYDSREEAEREIGEFVEMCAKRRKHGDGTKHDELRIVAIH